MVDTFREFAMEKPPTTSSTDVDKPCTKCGKKNLLSLLVLFSLTAVAIHAYVSYISEKTYTDLYQSLSHHAFPKHQLSEIAPKFSMNDYLNQITPLTQDEAALLCPLVDPISATNDDFAYFRTEEFRKKSLAALQGAVQVPTESYDDLGAVGQDPRWDVFFNFAAYLKKTFPAVHEHLVLDKINTHGLVYTWKGTDKTLKPVLLAAHQDVVPVLPDTRGLWDRDPYDGHFDGTFLWGRGSSDDKNPLIGILEAFEILLTKEPDFVPKRTVIAAFGFDEEISGYEGAAHIGKHLEEVYGKKSFDAIVDEGGSGVLQSQGVKFALPGVAEKGFFNVEVTLHTPGGHSSLPPDNTAVGIIGSLAVLIEETPFSPKLTTNNPFYQLLQCQAVYSPNLQEAYKQAIYHAGDDPKANQLVTAFLTKSKLTRYSIQTSQAIDIVKGGLKVNALPEEVQLITNFRVSIESNVNETRTKLVGNVLTTAHRFGLGVRVNATDNNTKKTTLTEILPATANGYFVVNDYGSHIEPAPVSPYTGPAWATLAGTIRHVFETYAGPIVDPLGNNTEAAMAAALKAGSLPNTTVVVAPSLMTANTDTRHYWKLSDNIFRFSPTRIENTKINNIHTVNEYLRLDVHLETVVFYYSYIKNLSK